MSMFVHHTEIIISRIEYLDFEKIPLQVTYRQLGERLRRGDVEEGRLESRLREEGRRAAAAIRCTVGERSRLENASHLAPRSIDFDTCSYEDLADYALPSERREM